MSLRGEARLRRFHQVGPWALVIVAGFAAIALEAVRHHVVNSEDVIYFLVLVPTIVLHEVSHGAVANLCGDPTAKDAGRLTLNPLKHIDPIGTVILPILLIVTFGTAFGWARPVPVSVNRLRHPRNQAVLVGLAGPAVNVVIAVICALVFKVLTDSGQQLPSNGFGLILAPSAWPLGDEILYFAGFANVIVAAFNLIPIPPLDGSAVLERLLPSSMLPQYYRIRPFSMLIVLGVVFLAPGVLNTVFNHAISYWDNLITG